MPKHDRYVASKSVVFRQEGNDAILFNTQNGRFDIINETGIAIWKQCDGTRTGDEIIAALADRYAGDRKKVGREARRFLNALLKDGLVRKQ